MDVSGAVCVITGGANGIGAAMARRFAAEGAAGIVVADLDGDAAANLADQLGPRAVAAGGDVTEAAWHHELVALAEERFGPVDLYCSNAGTGAPTGLDATPEEWDRVWRVNTMAHVHAARAVVPRMLERGSGWLLQTASAAGLLVNLGDASYTATKHAAVGFAEWLSATYRHRGIGVSCLCPMGVDTDLLRRASEGVAGKVVSGAGRVLSPDEVAGAVVDALRDGRFLVLPHPEVGRFWQHKAGDVDHWLTAMNGLQQALEGGAPS